jgi:hypothetical protein
VVANSPALASSFTTFIAWLRAIPWASATAPIDSSSSGWIAACSRMRSA